MKRNVDNFLAIVCFAFVATQTAAESQSNTACVEGAMDQRCKSAVSIIEKCNAFTEKANRLIAQAERATIDSRRLIAQAEKATSDSNRLNGAAKSFGTTFVPKIRALHGAQLATAKRMYQSDLSEFANHVAEYKLHNSEVRKQFGECAASRAAYEKNKDNYALHCKEFHMEDLPPPHVCVTMEEAVTNSEAAAGKLKSSVKRLVDSQVELMKTEGRLNAAVANSAKVDQDVHKQHELNLREQNLAVEFAKLEEEWKLLDVEKRTLSASGVGVSVTTVKARVRGK